MDGKHHQKILQIPNLNQTIKTNIEKWILSVNKIKEFTCDDFHINEFYTGFSSKETWLFGTEYCLKAVAETLKENKLPFQTFAAISLRSDEKPIGVNFGTSGQIENEFDHTPPSVYLFSNDYDFFGLNDKMMKIDISEFNSKKLECYYLEYKEPDDEEFRRSLWLKAN
jgi:hypothetical protein